MSIRNFLSKLFQKLSSYITDSSTSAALADLDKVKAKLHKAVDFHDKTAEVHEYLAEAHTKLADEHSDSAARAERVAAKLDDLLG
jgi:hypothetical protein